MTTSLMRPNLRAERLALTKTATEHFVIPQLPTGFTCQVNVDTSDEWLYEGRVFLPRLTYATSSETEYTEEWRSDVQCDSDLGICAGMIYDEFVGAIAALRRRAGILV